MNELEHLDCTRKMPLMSIDVRATVIALPNARVLFGPGSTLTDAQLRSAGEVTDIVAPSLWHTEGAIAAARVHPKARLWGPAGIEKKRPELSWHGILGRDAWPFDELTLVPIDGMPMINESVIVHGRDLLVADLLFNMPDARGLGAHVVMSMFGTWHRVAISRAFTLMIRDKAAFRASLQRILALDFDRVIPSHGVPVEDGKVKLRHALEERGYSI